jgi:hypothetical protein
VASELRMLDIIRRHKSIFKPHLFNEMYSVKQGKFPSLHGGETQVLEINFYNQINKLVSDEKVQVWGGYVFIN